MIHLQGDSHLQIILFSISEYHISYCFSEGLYNILHCLKIKISLVMKSQKIINRFYIRECDSGEIRERHELLGKEMKNKFQLHGNYNFY